MSGEGALRVTPSQMTQNHLRSARIDLLFTMSDNTRASGQSPLTCELISHERARLQLWLAALPHDRKRLVEPDGIEPTTSCLQSRRSPN
jgi:hypothetical protein